MKHSILLLGLLYSLSSSIFANELISIYQKDLISNQWLEQDEYDKKINPGALTQLIAGLTAFQILSEYSDKSDILINKKDYILSFSDNNYKELLDKTKITESDFISKMNQISKDINLKNTNFISSHSTIDSKQYTTPEDLMILVEFIYKNIPDINFISPTINQAILESQNSRRIFDSKKLCTPFVLGGKFNNYWNGIFISQNNYNNRIRRLISIVLNAPNIELLTDQAKHTITEGFTQYETLKIFNKGDIVGMVTVTNGAVQELPVSVDEDIFLSVRTSELKTKHQEPFRIQISYSSPVKAPVNKGEKIGSLTINLKNGVSINAPIFAAENIGKGNFWQRLTDRVNIALE